MGDVFYSPADFQPLHLGSSSHRVPDYFRSRSKCLWMAYAWPRCGVLCWSVQEM